MANELARVEANMTALDEIVKDFSLAKAGDVGQSFKEAMRLACVTRRIEELLTDEVMAVAIMPLKGKSYGFKTDEESRIKKNWGAYTIQDVRECCVDAIMRGLRVTNNEMNIIAKNAYAAKNGVKRLVKDLPGLTDLIIHPGLPKMMQGGAVIDMMAEFKLNGKPMKLERKGGEAFAVRINEGQGADAVLGKAERKMCAYILETITGSDHGVGEVDDLDESTLKTVAAIEVDVTKELPQPAAAPIPRSQEVKDAMNKAAVAKAKEDNKKSKAAQQPEQAATAQVPPTAVTTTATVAPPPTTPAPVATTAATAPAVVTKPAAQTVPQGVPTSGIPVGKKPRVHGWNNQKPIYHKADGSQTMDINKCGDWKDATPEIAASKRQAIPAPAAAQAPVTPAAAAIEALPQTPNEVTGEIETITVMINHMGQSKYKPDNKLGYNVRDDRNTLYLTFDKKLALKANTFFELKKKVVIGYLEKGPIYSLYGKYEIVDVVEAPAEEAPPQEQDNTFPNDGDLEIPEDNESAVHDGM